MDVVELQRLWAKSPGDDGQIVGRTLEHPLLLHMIDTAAVAGVVWDGVLPEFIRREAAEGLGLAPTPAKALFTFLAAMHDIGKASPSFQGQWAPGKERLVQQGYPWPEFGQKAPHGTITARALKELLEQSGFSRRLAAPLGKAVGGHHGAFPRDGDMATLIDAMGSPQSRWGTARRALFDELWAVCGMGAGSIPSRSVTVAPWVLGLLAGFTSVSDWIASSEEHFPHGGVVADVAEYAARASVGAARIIERIGWMSSTSAGAALTFQNIFEMDPRPVQTAVTEQAATMHEPGIFIIEAPTGEGKTEAALFLAEAFAQQLGTRGLYFALPTQATSDQMFTRILHHLRRVYTGDVELQLLHGHAALSAEFALIRRGGADPLAVTGIGEETGYDGASASVVASEWFTHRKRGLLAAHGVGTVDQVLLSVLQTKHFFVRLFGLAGKVVIIDEVHAYDAYMTALLDRLLQWLSALRCPVVLLSATLPRERRLELLFAYSGKSSVGDGGACPYPRISWASASTSGSRSVRVSDVGTKTIAVGWLPASLDGDTPQRLLGPWLKDQLRDGGCAAVVCNTVGQAQRAYTALRSYFDPCELDLLHAQFTRDERTARERRVMKAFGKGGGGHNNHARPARAVLVATQVVEQSLDLDFDLMVTALAPIDIVLQRAGRLHRFEAGHHIRPERLKRPGLWIQAPAMGPDGQPKFEPGDIHVYHPHILLASWLSLRSRSTLELPRDTEDLIASVYGDTAPEGLSGSLADLWRSTRLDLEEQREISKNEARYRSIAPPAEDKLENFLECSQGMLEEENPEIHKSLQALTRNSGPSLRAVILYGDGRDVFLDEQRTRRVDLERVPNASAARELLGRSVTLTHRGLVAQLLGTSACPQAWTKSALLRHHRAVAVDPGGRADIGPWSLRLDQERGVMVSRRDSADIGAGGDD